MKQKNKPGPKPKPEGEQIVHVVGYCKKKNHSKAKLLIDTLIKKHKL
jgi:hypothetical protein